MTTITKSQTVAGDIAALLRARNPLLWIVTREEARVERYLIEAAAGASYIPRTWDVAQGIVDIAGDPVDGVPNGTQDPGEALDLDDAKPVAAPAATARALDLAPAAEGGKVKKPKAAAARAAEI